jgi:hypothetical protein
VLNVDVEARAEEPNTKIVDDESIEFIAKE